MLWEGIRVEQRESAQVAYVPKILRNMTEICKEMGVSAKIVRRWAADGAPIVLDGSGNKVRYSTEAAALQAWRVAQSTAEVPAESE